MPTVHKKLMQARIQFQGKELRKTGHNEFSGYYYFELCDFLPTVQAIFAELGLCGVVSFTADLASLTITDVEDGSSVTITSPMGSAKLKACHEVQNIGAVETYQRRYLWITAMEIVEHDALDGGAGADDDEGAGKVHTPPRQPAATVPPELLAAARKASGNGVAAYQHFWTSTGPENRKLLAGHHESLKVAAQKAKVPA